MNVILCHPRRSITFQAQVDSHTTAQTCIEGLVKEGFIEPADKNRPYALKLQRTNQQLLDSNTMQQAGVKDQDSLIVLQSEQGAASDRLTRMKQTKG